MNASLPIHRKIIIVALLLAGAATASAQELWEGVWSTRNHAEHGTLSFTLNSDGTLTGAVTNAGVHGSWRGFFADDGVMYAYYSYPFYEARQAITRFSRRDGDTAHGVVTFWADGQPAGDATVSLRRAAQLKPGNAGSDGAAPDWPFSGNGQAVWCARGANCPKRSLASMPGDWHGLFAARATAVSR